MAAPTNPQSDSALDLSNVFVKYLPPEVDDKEFHRMFKNYGNIVSCKIMVDQTSGKSLGYGYNPRRPALR